MLTIRIMRLKQCSVEPKFKSSEPKEGAVMPLVRKRHQQDCFARTRRPSPSEDLFDRSADVQILRLRRTLKTDPRAPSIIRAECNVGYVFVLPPCCPDLGTKTVTQNQGC